MNYHVSRNSLAHSDNCSEHMIILIKGEVLLQINQLDHLLFLSFFFFLSLGVPVSSNSPGLSSSGRLLFMLINIDWTAQSQKHVIVFPPVRHFLTLLLSQGLASCDSPGTESLIFIR